MMEINSIELRDVTVGYGNVPVIRDINAGLRRGEFTCLLGPNGAGKSTLLRTLCGFQPPLAGEILIDDKQLKKYSPRELARKIGVVLTERPSTINMTVAELVAVGRSPYTSFMGGLRAHDRDIVDESILQVGIESLRHRLVSTLSDGERQKALIAKTLAQQTEIVFLDEPTAFLDYPSKVETMKLLYAIAHEKGKTVFMSTHDIELALQLADKVWLLDKRIGLTVGTPRELASNGMLEAYFETPSLRFVADDIRFEVI